MEPIDESETGNWFDLVRKGVKTPTFANTGWSAMGTVANGMVGAVSSAILARFLGIADFGTLVLVISILNLVSELADFGLGSAIVKFGAPALEQRNPERFHLVASLVFRLKLLLGAAVLLVAVLFVGPIVSSVFGHMDDQVKWYFQLSLVAAGLTIVGSIQLPIFQAHRSFRTLAIVISSRYILKLVLLLGAMAVVTQWSVEIGVWLEIASAVAFVVFGFSLTPVRKLSLGLRDAKLQREVLRFNRWISLQQIITLFGGRADVFFLGGFSDANALGLYGAASKIAGVIQLAASSYYSALLPEFSAATSSAEMSHRRRSSLGVGVLLIVAIGIAALCAEPVSVLLFGEEYREAGTILQVMSIGLAFHVLAHPFMAVLFASNRSALLPIVSGISMGVFIFCNVLLVPEYGPIGAAAAFSAGGCATFLMALGCSKKGKGPVAAVDERTDSNSATLTD